MSLRSGVLQRVLRPLVMPGAQQPPALFATLSAQALFPLRTMPSRDGVRRLTSDRTIGSCCEGHSMMRPFASLQPMEQLLDSVLFPTAVERGEPEEAVMEGYQMDSTLRKRRRKVCASPGTLLSLTLCLVDEQARKFARVPPRSACHISPYL
jgi:hypothetical protein